MSATEVIEQIKALPADEQAKVAKFVRELPTNGSESRVGDDVKAASEWVIANYSELLKKLAQ